MSEEASNRGLWRLTSRLLKSPLDAFRLLCLTHAPCASGLPHLLRRENILQGKSTGGACWGWEGSHDYARVTMKRRSRPVEEGSVWYANLELQRGMSSLVRTLSWTTRLKRGFIRLAVLVPCTSPPTISPIFLCSAQTVGVDRPAVWCPWHVCVRFIRRRRPAPAADAGRRVLDDWFCCRRLRAASVPPAAAGTTRRQPRPSSMGVACRTRGGGESLFLRHCRHPHLLYHYGAAPRGGWARTQEADCSRGRGVIEEHVEFAFFGGA